MAVTLDLAWIGFVEVCKDPKVPIKWRRQPTKGSRRQTLKFIYSEKATHFWKNQIFLTLPSTSQNSWKICSKNVGLLRISELYFGAPCYFTRYLAKIVKGGCTKNIIATSKVIWIYCATALELSQRECVSIDT